MLCSHGGNPHAQKNAGRNQVQQDMELCMQRGHEEKGRLIGTSLAGPTAARGTPVTCTDCQVRRNSHHHIWDQPPRLHGYPPPATWQAHSGSTPTARKPAHNHPPTASPQQPDRSRATHILATGTMTHENDHADVGSGTTGPTASQPSMWRPALPGNDHIAIEPTARPQTDHRQTSEYRTGRTCKGQNRTGVLRSGDTTVRHAC